MRDRNYYARIDALCDNAPALNLPDCQEREAVVQSERSERFGGALRGRTVLDLLNPDFGLGSVCVDRRAVRLVPLFHTSCRVQVLMDMETRSLPLELLGGTGSERLRSELAAQFRQLVLSGMEKCRVYGRELAGVAG